MDRELIGDFETDPNGPAFSPERRDPAMDYGAIRCPCGGGVFRLAGWPRAVSGSGGFFWRSLTRVWREARMAVENGELVESPFRLPLFARCARCDRERTLLDDERVVGRVEAEGRGEPRESVRCRACRRGAFELVVGQARESAPPAPPAVEVVVRCGSCRRQARLAWSDDVPSEQQRRLDLLYGRR